MKGMLRKIARARRARKILDTEQYRGTRECQENIYCPALGEKKALIGRVECVEINTGLEEQECGQSGERKYLKETITPVRNAINEGMNWCPITSNYFLTFLKIGLILITE